MMEIIQAAISPPTLVFTVLLGLMLLYWVLMIFGALHLDVFGVDAHIDGDVDGDVDLHLDADGHIDGHADIPIPAFRSALEFFYVGRVPVMLLFSIFVLSLWTISMVANHLLNPWDSAGVGLLIAGGNVVVSLMVLKAVGLPLERLFRHFYHDANAIDNVVGMLATVVSNKITAKRLGQVEIHSRGSTVRLNALTGGETVSRGQEVVVLERAGRTGPYVIAPVEGEDDS